MTRLALPIVLLLPLVMTRWQGSKSTNQLTGLLLVLLAIPFLPEVLIRLSRSINRAAIVLASIVVIAYVLAWQEQGAGLWINSQLLLYVGVIVAYPVMLEWFRYNKSRSFDFIFRLKLSAIFVVTIIYLVAISKLPEGAQAAAELINNPPVHIHVRTMKYEMALIVCLSIYYATISKAKITRFFWSLAFLAFGYLTVWSAGRGAMLTVSIFVSLVLAFRIVSWRSVLYWFSTFLAGGALVLLSGKVDFLLRRTRQISAEPNSVTAGRWEIWRDSIHVWWTDPVTVVFGAGPDAFRSIIKPQIDISSGIIQPHNFVLQIIFEFGIIGLVCFLLMMVPVGRRAAFFLYSHDVPTLKRVVAATLVSGVVFSMVDGLFYHALSLTFMGFLFAFIMAPDRGGSSQLS